MAAPLAPPFVTFRGVLGSVIRCFSAGKAGHGINRTPDATGTNLWVVHTYPHPHRLEDPVEEVVVKMQREIGGYPDFCCT